MFLLFEVSGTGNLLFRCSTDTGKSAKPERIKKDVANHLWGTVADDAEYNCRMDCGFIRRIAITLRTAIFLSTSEIHRNRAL